MKTLLTLTALFASTFGEPDAMTAQEDLAATVREQVARWSTTDSPGGAVCVLRGGEPILLEVFGMADIEQERANTLTTPFYVASVSKTFTAFAAMHASRADKLDLDATLREHFPELAESYGAATLRQAMHHTSGVIDVYDTVIAADLSAEALSSNASTLKLLERLKTLSFKPGSRFLYSNSGYVLLAEALRRATKVSLAEYAREHIFEPFGMKQAGYLGEHAFENAALSYGGGQGSWSPLEIKTGLHGPGGLFLSVEDLQHFALGLRKERESGRLADLFRAVPGSDHASLGRYTAGWMLTMVRGLNAQRHYGGGFGYSADLLRFPEYDVTIIALSNASDLSARDMSEAVAGLVLTTEIQAAESSPPPAVQLTSEDVRRFGRLWSSPESGEMFILTPKQSGFVIAALGDLKLKLTATSRTRLEAVETLVPFVLELEGGNLIMRSADRKPVVLKNLPFPPRDLSPAAELAGKYVCEMLESTIQLEALPNGFLRMEQHDPVLELPPFLPLGPDLYFCDKGARIDFHRGEDGQVVGLTMHANRAWGLEFKRAE